MDFFSSTFSACLFRLLCRQKNCLTITIPITRPGGLFSTVFWTPWDWIMSDMPGCWPAFFSCLGSVFGLVVSVTHKPKPALVATMLLSLSPFFFPYPDSFFQTGYLNAYVFGILLFFVRQAKEVWEWPKKKAFCWFTSGWILMFVQSWVSFEGTPFILTFMFLYAFLIARAGLRRSFLVILIYGSAVLAFLVGTASRWGGHSEIIARLGMIWSKVSLRRQRALLESLTFSKCGTGF